MTIEAAASDGRDPLALVSDNEAAAALLHPTRLRILLTLAVPYVVSTVSSVAAMREMRKKDEP